MSGRLAISTSIGVGMAIAGALLTSPLAAQTPSRAQEEARTLIREVAASLRAKDAANEAPMPRNWKPSLTSEGQRRAEARAEARRASGRGPADSYEDRSLYDQCISRGLPGSMMPAIYGSSYQIHQGPGYIAIRYEMIHETRVIPLGGGPHIGGGIRTYMGDARGRWDGNVLIVETTNFKDQTAYRGADGSSLRLVERFTPIGPNTVQWAVTVDDARTWTRPWTFAMNLTKKDQSQQPYEYACHEGNYGLPNILSAARAVDRAAEAK